MFSRTISQVSSQKRRLLNFEFFLPWYLATKVESFKHKINVWKTQYLNSISIMKYCFRTWPWNISMTWRLQHSSCLLPNEKAAGFCGSHFANKWLTHNNMWQDRKKEFQLALVILKYLRLCILVAILTGTGPAVVPGAAGVTRLCTQASHSTTPPVVCSATSLKFTHQVLFCFLFCFFAVSSMQTRTTIMKWRPCGGAGSTRTSEYSTPRLRCRTTTMWVTITHCWNIATWRIFFFFCLDRDCAYSQK